MLAKILEFSKNLQVKNMKKTQVKHLPKMPFTWVSGLMIGSTACLLMACQPSEPTPEPTKTANGTPSAETTSSIPAEVRDTLSLDYYWRLNREGFLNSSDPLINSKLKNPSLSLSELLIPPAMAEVPPEHQKLFSLHLSFDHQAQTMVAQWRYQLRTQPESAEYAQKSYDAAAYAQLIQDLSAKPLTCASKLEQMMVGPAPIKLSITKQSGSQTYNASGDVGQGEYICHQGLIDELNALRSELSKQNWASL